MHRFSSVVFSETGCLAELLESTGLVEVRARAEHARELEAVLDDHEPSALFVELGNDPEAAFGAVEKICEPKPVLVFHGPDDSQWILKAMRVGASEYVAAGPDERDQLSAAIQRLAPELAAKAPSGRGSLIAVMGTKGGVGATFTACQLGAALAAKGDSVVIVDGHTRMGDVALHLDLSPEYTVADLASQSGSLDSTYLRTTLSGHPSGVRVLASPKRPEEGDIVSLDCIAQVLGLLVADFDWVIWDLPRDFDDASVHVLDRANQILLVTTPDVPALHHTRVQLDLLGRLGRDAACLRTVVNRFDKKAVVSGKDAESFLGRPVDGVLPNDYANASICVNEGRTMNDVASRSPLSQAVSGLATNVRQWCGRESLESGSKRGFLARLRSN